MQNAIYFRGVAKPAKFKFQCGKLRKIFYIKLEHLAVRKMIEQSTNL